MVVQTVAQGAHIKGIETALLTVLNDIYASIPTPATSDGASDIQHIWSRLDAEYVLDIATLLSGS